MFTAGVACAWTTGELPVVDGVTEPTAAGADAVGADADATVLTDVTADGADTAGAAELVADGEVAAVFKDEEVTGVMVTPIRWPMAHIAGC